MEHQKAYKAEPQPELQPEPISPYRIEHDTMGEVRVPADCRWGAQTQRSKENFKIGGQRQPLEIIYAFSYLKEACPLVNAREGKLTK